MPTDRDRILVELLVLRCRRGDTDAPGVLVEHFQRPLLYYLRRLLPGEADAWDVSQETWLSVFRTLHRLRDTRTFPAFIYKVARHAAFAQLRQRRVTVVETLDGEADDDASRRRKQCCGSNSACSKPPSENKSSPNHQRGGATSVALFRRS